MNYELRITNKYKKIFLVLLLAVSYWLLATPALAHPDGIFWRPGDAIVPCGPDYQIPPADGVGPPRTVDRPDCDKCQLLHLVRHVIDFIMVAAAPILATLFFIIAGVYLILGGANPSMLSTGKRIFKDTFIGILIVMLAWLITNTLIRTLAAETVTLTIGGQQVPWSSANWWTFSCDESGFRPGP